MQSLLSKPLVTDLRFNLKKQVAELVDRDVEPHLAAVLVGEDEQSLRYVDIKQRTAREVGIIFSLYHLEGRSTLAETLETIRFLAADPEVHGIILQLPLPEQFSPTDVETLIMAIPAAKDVDGLRGDWQTLHYTSYTTESLLQPQPYAFPPMVPAVTSLLNYYNITLKDKKIVLVGQGKLVGQPLTAFYTLLGLSVSSVDETTDNILKITKEADILISGTGQHEIITYQWVKEGAVVIDCSHDIHTDSVEQIASALAPSTGGVGPLTVFWLLHNTYQAARNQS